MIVADGLYLNVPFLRVVLKCHMEAVIRLKGERRLIFQDAEKLLSLYSGLLARMAISELCGIYPNNLCFTIILNHKPRLCSYPALDFSISHTLNAILCCLSFNDSVGCDIEQVTTPPLEIMNDVFHPEEIQYILNPDAKNMAKHFYEIWTRKEAFTKSLGIGLACDLTNYNTISIPLSNSLFTWQSRIYICSVCGNNLNIKYFKTVTESDVQDFFEKS